MVLNLLKWLGDGSGSSSRHEFHKLVKVEAKLICFSITGYKHMSCLSQNVTSDVKQKTYRHRRNLNKMTSNEGCQFFKKNWLKNNREVIFQFFMKYSFLFDFYICFKNFGTCNDKKLRHIKVGRFCYFRIY